MEEWVEVRAKTVEEAIEEGLRALGLESREAADVEVLQEPQKGFLGFGGEPALVRMKAKPKRRQRRRGRGGGEEPKERRRGGDTRTSGGGGERRQQARPAGHEGGRKPRADSAQRQGPGRRSDQARSTEVRQPRVSEPRRTAGHRSAEDAPSPAEVAEQAEVVRGFLIGLVQSFGLEGEVATRVEGDIIYAEVTGDQTEALVGTKGVILDAVMELCRTMVHRRSQAGARLRLDIAGYAERRREALRIYARRLAAKVIEEGGEIMLEPMNPADRKVVHDAIAELDGVRSFSEGEDPERSVVISPEDGDDD